MKNSTLISILISFAGLLPFMAACGNDKSDEPSTPSQTVNITVSPESASVSPDAASYQFVITGDSDWGIRTDADWVKLTPSGGTKNTPVTVKATVTANTGFDSRTADLNIVVAGKTVKTISLTQGYVTKASLSATSITMGAQESSANVTVTANADWQLSTEADWISINPAKGGKGDTDVTISAKPNASDATREAEVTLTCGDIKTEIKVSQLSDVVVTPEGYSLVWSDEFNEGTVPGPDWVLENWPAGYVNNELQIYTSKEIDGKRTAEIKDGMLYINCFKAADGKIYSARMNAKPNTGWTYGYFEARMNLPAGKGTWPAFWMMPSNVDWNTNPWPLCGEIDIMEEVGANPNYVSSSLHTENYNHTKGTQKTHEMYCAGAEGSFHVYALEWTEDAITTYVDGKVQLSVTKQAMGADHASWPFHYAFYPILNLAWGGDWGGYKGVDDSVLPVSLKVDYVRIFQKNK